MRQLIIGIFIILLLLIAGMNSFNFPGGLNYEVGVKSDVLTILIGVLLIAIPILIYRTGRRRIQDSNEIRQQQELRVDLIESVDIQKKDK